MVYLSLFCGVIYMLCIINCQYTHNQGKFCQNFQFFHIYSTVTSFSVNLHHFTVTKPKFRSKSPKFRSTKPKFRSECNEISFFEFKITFQSKLPKFSEISPEILFPPDGGIRWKNEKENPERDSKTKLQRDANSSVTPGRVRFENCAACSSWIKAKLSPIRDGYACGPRDPCHNQSCELRQLGCV